MKDAAEPLWPEGLSEISVYTVLPRTAGPAEEAKRTEPRREAASAAPADGDRRRRSGVRRRA